jgi:hypothetical protein
MGLKSLSQRIECARMESWCLGMINECLGLLLHAPRGPFYSPKAARSHWRHSWKAKVAFCRVAHRTVRCAISFHSWCSRPLQLCGSWHTGQSGAPLLTVGAGHASPADLASDRCAGGRWLTGQSGAPPDSPVNYSRTPPNFSGEWPVRRRPAWRTGHCPVHHRTVWCARLC